MIELYYWPTPNGHKISIMLEECGLPYEVRRVDIGAGDQFSPEFLAISPNNRMPAIVDRETGISVFEGGAILMYLAEKTGRLMPADAKGRSLVVQWLMFQMGGIGPMLGQAHHFRIYAPEKIDYAIDRYTNEANRLVNVLDKRLAESRFVSCDEYTIADMAIFPWMRGSENRGINLDEYPNAKRWFEEIDTRPAVKRGVQVLASSHEIQPHDDKSWEIMFGKAQFERR